MRGIEPHVAGIAALWSPTPPSSTTGEVAEAMARDLPAARRRDRARRRRHEDRAAGERLDLWAARRAVLTPPPHQLRRPLLRRGRAPGGRDARRPDRPVPRRVLHDPAGAPPPRARPDLPGARSRVPVPRRALHPHHRTARWKRARTRCWLRPRGLHVRPTCGRSSSARRSPTRGMWHMARKYWKTGGYEMYRSLSKKAFVKALQRLVPEIHPEDVERGRRGRARAGRRAGRLARRRFPHRRRDSDAIHVLNAPSPGATASLSIGRHIAGLARGALWSDLSRRRLCAPCFA